MQYKKSFIEVKIKMGDEKYWYGVQCIRNYNLFGLQQQM